MPTVSNNVAALSAYAGKHQKGLIGQLVNGLDFANDVTVKRNVKNKLQLPKLSVARGARPFSSETEFKSGQLVYSNRTLEVGAGKRELLIDPEVYRETFLSEALTPGSAANKKEIPYEAFTWMKVIENLAAEINDYTAYNGFDRADAVAFDAGDTYAAGDYITYAQNGITEYWKCLATTTAGQDPDDTPAKWQNVTAEAITKGWGTLIGELVTATSLSPVTIGAISTGAEALAGMKELFRDFGPAYKKRQIIIHCSYTNFEYLLDGIKEYSKYTRDDVNKMEGENLIILPETAKKCIVKPASWLGESGRLIAEPAFMEAGQWKGQNLCFGTDVLSDMNVIKTKENLWTLEAGIKFLCGFEIADLEALRIGDQV